MAVRDRTRVFGATAGTYKDSLGRLTNRTRQCTTSERCEDVVEPGDGNNLTITRYELFGSHTGSEYRPGLGSNWKEVNNFCLQQFSSVSLMENISSHLTVADEPTDTWLATRLVAMTNPSRPDIDLPAFFGEFMDLPNLVRKAGDGLITKLADANLKVQFGVLPLVGDATVLLDFVDHVDKRLAELRALQRSGLRRTRTLFRGSTSVLPGAEVFLNSSPAQVIVKGKHQRTTDVRAWGHVKWFPTGDFPTTDRTKLILARKAVLGLTKGDPAASVWEVIPWSWLVDWYVNVGTFLNAQRNTVPCTHSVPEIMRTKSTVSTHWITTSADFPGAFPVGSIIRTKKTSKTRRTATVSLSARLPVLSLRQLSILGSLLVLKNKGRRYLS